MSSSSSEQSSRMTSPPIRIRYPPLSPTFGELRSAVFPKGSGSFAPESRTKLPPQPNPYIVPLISGIGFAAGAASYGLIRKLFDPSATPNGLRESVDVQHNISKPR